MYALCDCNNFYASCERVFRPDLECKPVIVLSNNDGCVIARSQEAKDLGIEMGAPAFLIKEFIEKNKVNVFSSNYTLYGDFSARVMTTLSSFVRNFEVYSIDEIFLDLKGYDYYDLYEYCKVIRKTVRQNTKVPVSIGIAPTKTLAKIANKIAKKKHKQVGVFQFTNDVVIKSELENFEVGDVWGIGGQYKKLLIKNGITTAWQLRNVDDNWARKNMTVQGARLINELRGIPCIQLEEFRPKKKGICVSRSFGTMISDKETIEEALSNYANRAGEKLRREGSICASLSVFLETNQFREDLPQYVNSKHIQLPFPTNDSAELIKWALEGLQKIYRKGYNYKKTGIFIFDICPDDNVQLNIFEEEPDFDRKKNMNAVIDKLNKSFGRNVVRYGVMGYGKKWKLRQEMLSPCYTTRIQDVFTIKA